MIERLQFAKYPKNSIVFEQGNDTNKDFYIILGGSIEVWVKDPENKASLKKKSAANSIHLDPKSRNKSGDSLESEEDSHDSNEERARLASIQEIVDCNSVLGEEVEEERISKTDNANDHELNKPTAKLERQPSCFVMIKNSQTSIGKEKKEIQESNIKKKTLIVFPTPKTDSEKRKIKSTLFSNGESVRANALGYKYLPLMGADGVNMDSPSMVENHLEFTSIVDQVSSAKK